jgi:hypothetical protein
MAFYHGAPGTVAAIRYLGGVPTWRFLPNLSVDPFLFTGPWI